MKSIFIVSLYYFYNVYRICNDAPFLIYNICYVCFYLLFLIGLARGLLSLLIFPKINLSTSKFLTLLFGMFVFYFINSRSDSYSFSLLLSLCYLAILFLTSWDGWSISVVCCFFKFSFTRFLVHLIISFIKDS